MSLQAAAQHLANQGRGNDSTLVHMSPREVKSLQELAMAHGGSLSVNPNTGLPEAGFLESILPVVAGIALGPAGIGLSAMEAGLATGALGLAASGGDLKKGLMAGLGAYGGAGLMGGLIGTGASQLGEATAQEMAGGLGNATAAELNAARASAAQNIAQTSPLSAAGQGVKSIFSHPEGISAGLSNLGSNISTGFGSSPLMKLGTTAAAAAAPLLLGGDNEAKGQTSKTETAPVYSYAANATSPTPQPNVPRSIDYRNFVPGQTVSPQSQRFGAEQRYFNPMYTQTGTNTYQVAQAPDVNTKFLGLFADGGITDEPTDFSSVGMNTNYPQSAIPQENYSSSWHSPAARNMLNNSADVGYNPNTGQMNFAGGGVSHLGDYSDGGRLLRGPGDGVSDDIPAMIGKKQPARLADGEFVVPARIVSELGNGSTEAGARKLYAMMDRIQANRKKTMGRGKQFAKDSKADRYLPA